eukprot:3787974-Rhodomonas_salina.1
MAQRKLCVNDLVHAVNPSWRKGGCLGCARKAHPAALIAEIEVRLGGVEASQQRIERMLEQMAGGAGTSTELNGRPAGWGRPAMQESPADAVMGEVASAGPQKGSDATDVEEFTAPGQVMS